MSEIIWTRIDAAHARWDVLRHPFYRRWSAGALSADELARYSGQYRHAVRAIADASATAAAALPERLDLREHAAEEAEHVGLWDGFLEAAGGSAADDPTPETAACVSAWTRDDGALAILARLYAIEATQPAISETKRAGLISCYGFEDGRATAYFRVHASRDAEHAEEVRELIAHVAVEDDVQRVVAAAEDALRANWRLLDGMTPA